MKKMISYKSLLSCVFFGALAGTGCGDVWGAQLRAADAALAIADDGTDLGANERVFNDNRIELLGARLMRSVGEVDGLQVAIANLKGANGGGVAGADVNAGGGVAFVNYARAKGHVEGAMGLQGGELSDADFVAFIWAVSEMGLANSGALTGGNGDGGLAEFVGWERGAVRAGGRLAMILGGNAAVAQNRVLDVAKVAAYEDVKSAYDYVRTAAQTRNHAFTAAERADIFALAEALVGNAGGRVARCDSAAIKMITNLQQGLGYQYQARCQGGQAVGGMAEDFENLGNILAYSYEMLDSDKKVSCGTWYALESGMVDAECNLGHVAALTSALENMMVRKGSGGASEKFVGAEAELFKNLSAAVVFERFVREGELGGFYNENDDVKKVVDGVVKSYNENKDFAVGRFKKSFVRDVKRIAALRRKAGAPLGGTSPTVAPDTRGTGTAGGATQQPAKTTPTVKNLKALQELIDGNAELAGKFSRHFKTSSVEKLLRHEPTIRKSVYNAIKNTFNVKPEEYGFPEVK